MKKGFTLIEMLITVVLIGIVSALVIPNIISTKEDALKKDLDIKVKNIESASYEWANDNLEHLKLDVDSNNRNYTVCNYVYVDELISKGYIVGDKNNKTILKNPVNNEELNNYKVCVRYDISKGFSNRIMEANLEGI